MGMPIPMEGEPHEGGRHGRYLVVGGVKIRYRSDRLGKEAA